MSSDKFVTLADGNSYWLDNGIADIIVELNNKGYRTICSCEGHMYDCTGYKKPKNRREYGQYSPVWIVFKSGHLPPYPPIIKGYISSKLDPWKCEHARIFFGSDELAIAFETYKRYRPDNVDIEHKRVLNEVLKWAQNLPQKE